MLSCISNNNVCMHHGAPRGESGWVVKAKREKELHTHTRTHARTTRTKRKFMHERGNSHRSKGVCVCVWKRVDEGTLNA